MAHDVFISYSTADKLAADAVCHGLEAQGIRCWIAPRDQIAGKPYGEQITGAIHDAKVLVLIFSEHVNQSHAVHNEIDLAAGDNIAIIPFRISGDEFNQELRFYLGRVHWLDAFPLPVGHYIDNLVAMVKRNLPAGDQAPPGAATPPVPPVDPTPHPLPVPPPAPTRTSYTPMLVIGGVVAAVIILALIVNSLAHPSKPGANTLAAANTSAPSGASGGAGGSSSSSSGGVATPAPAPASVQDPRVQYFETEVTPDGPPLTLEGAAVLNTAALYQKMELRGQNADSFVLVDARGCVTDVTISGAVCLQPWDNVAALQQRVPLGEPIVVFCHNGGCPLSFELGQKIMQAGYQHVSWYRGGIDAWTAAGLPVMHFTSQDMAS